MRQLVMRVATKRKIIDDIKATATHRNDVMEIEPAPLLAATAVGASVGALIALLRDDLILHGSRNGMATRLGIS